MIYTLSPLTIDPPLYSFFGFDYFFSVLRIIHLKKKPGEIYLYVATLLKEGL